MVYQLKKKISILFLLCSAGLLGCSSQRPLQNPTLSATLWVQNAAEFKALTTSVYESAAQNLDSLLRAKNHTAMLEQQDMEYRSLPPAIILDVDETVLDNAPFQARLIKQNESYSPEKWNSWVREEQADAIPGAVRFTQKADAMGITVFYLTNREAQVEMATFNNLDALGFPLKDDVDVLLTKNEEPGWTSAKVDRRKHVAQNYRVIMLLGDNLNDLLDADDISHQERLNLVKKYEPRFGTQWFVLPNPVYGSWEQALYNFEDLPLKEVNRRKMEKLHTKN